MGKRGQLTIYILIAILIVSTILIYFSLRGDILQNVISSPSDEVSLFVQDCIESEGANVIYTIGKNGGYYIPTDFSIDIGIPYYSSDGENYMPSKESVENEISFYLSEVLFLCTKNFVDFSNFNISQSEIKTNVNIDDDKISLNVNYPIRIIKGEDVSLIEEFEAEIPVRLGIVYDSISEFTQEQISHDGICLSCMLEISLKNDLFVDMFDYDDSTTVFFFRDENSKINDIPFTWVFANKYQDE